MTAFEKIIKTSGAASKALKVLEAAEICVAVAACVVCAVYAYGYAKGER